MSAPTVEAFQAEARAWLATNAPRAPRDYGPICPPELIDAGVAWQRLLHDGGYAGIHWPTDVGGRGLTPAHNAAFLLECAVAGVPPLLNMVGLVLTGGSILMFGTEEQKQE